MLEGSFFHNPQFGGARGGSPRLTLPKAMILQVLRQNLISASHPSPNAVTSSNAPRIYLYCNTVMPENDDMPVYSATTSTKRASTGFGPSENARVVFSSTAAA